MVISERDYMQGCTPLGSTGFDYFIGDISRTASGGWDLMHIRECDFPEPTLIWLLLCWDIPCCIRDFPGTISSVNMNCTNALCGAVPNLSVCGLTTAGTFNTAVQYFVSHSWCKGKNHACSEEAHFQGGAGSMSLFFLIIQAANTSNKDNDVPKLIFCN